MNIVDEVDRMDPVDGAQAGTACAVHSVHMVHFVPVVHQHANLRQGHLGIISTFFEKRSFFLAHLYLSRVMFTLIDMWRLTHLWRPWSFSRASGRSYR